MVMQCVRWTAPCQMDRIGDSGHPRRLSIAPSWWYRLWLLWINGQAGQAFSVLRDEKATMEACKGLYDGVDVLDIP